MRAAIKTVYIADDDKLFEDMQKCQDYEKDLFEKRKYTTYWMISSEPDLTKGRGWYRFSYLKVYTNVGCDQALVEDWCYRTFGRKIAFVQGCSPVENWRISKIDEKTYRNASEAPKQFYEVGFFDLAFTSDKEIGLIDINNFEDIKE